MVSLFIQTIYLLKEKIQDGVALHLFPMEIMLELG